MTAYVKYDTFAIEGVILSTILKQRGPLCYPALHENDEPKTSILYTTNRGQW